MTLRRLLIAVVTILVSHAALAIPCETQHLSAVMALSSTRLPEGTHQKIATKIANAWRIFSSGSTQSNANAVAQLDQAKKLLDGPAVKNVPIELRNDVAAAIDALSSCIGSSVVPTVPVTVLVFTGETAAGPGPAAGGGVTIRVDGDEAAKTKPDGTATINVPLGYRHFTAEQLPDWKGSARSIEILESGNLPVSIAMASGSDLSVAAELQIVELQDGVLPSDFTAATLQFVGDDGKTIRVRRLDTIELRSDADLLDVTKMFALRPDGTIALASADAFRTEVLDRYDPLRLSVHAFDDKGMPYRNSVQFAVGRYHASAAVQAPAGVTINPAAILVSVTNEKVSLSFWSVTTDDGKATFPLLPAGHYLVACDSCRTVRGTTAAADSSSMRMARRSMCRSSRFRRSHRQRRRRMRQRAPEARRPRARSHSSGTTSTTTAARIRSESRAVRNRRSFRSRSATPRTGRCVRSSFRMSSGRSTSSQPRSLSCWRRGKRMTQPTRRVITASSARVCTTSGATSSSARTSRSISSSYAQECGRKSRNHSLPSTCPRSMPTDWN